MAASHLCLVFTICGVVASSQLYDYQVEFIKPSMISVSNIRGRLNVTVKYSTNSLVYKVPSYWWVNGKRVADGVDRYKVEEYYVRGRDFTDTEVATDSKYPPDDHLKRTSILVPGKVEVTSLELQLVSDLIDVRVFINAKKPAPGNTIFERVPKVKTEMSPSGLHQYETVDDLLFRLHLTATDLKTRTPEEVTAEFIEADQCITPPIFEKITSEGNKTFCEIWKPTYDDDLTLEEMTRINSDDHIIRHLKINNGNADLLPKGLLRVSVGYKGIFSCGIFSGLRVTHLTILQPPPHSKDSLIGEKTLAFVEIPSQYVVNRGEDLDITITAVGGKMAKNRYGTIVPSHPEVYVRKRGKKFKVIADVKQLLQREITLRLKKVTANKAGRYVVVAKTGKKIIKKDILVYVRGRTGSCGR